MSLSSIHCVGDTFNIVRLHIFHDHRLLEEFEDTKGVIQIRKSKKHRQHNDQKKMDNRTNI